MICERWIDLGTAVVQCLRSDCVLACSLRPDNIAGFLRPAGQFMAGLVRSNVNNEVSPPSHMRLSSPLVFYSCLRKAFIRMSKAVTISLLVVALVCVGVPLVLAQYDGSFRPVSSLDIKGKKVFVVEGEVEVSNEIGIQWYTHYKGRTLVDISTQHAKVSGTDQSTSWYVFSNGTEIDGAEVLSYNEKAGNFRVVESTNRDGYFDDDDPRTTCDFGKWCDVGVIRFYGEMVSTDDIPERPERSDLIQIISSGVSRVQVTDDVTFNLFNQGEYTWDGNGIVVAPEDVSKFSMLSFQTSSIYSGASWNDFFNFTYVAEQEVLFYSMDTNGHVISSSVDCGKRGSRMPSCRLFHP